MCVLDVWMPCIYADRCFENLTCWLDLWLSCLLVAYISLCFCLLEKLLFFKLDSFSINPQKIPFYRACLSPFSIDPRQILSPLRNFPVLSAFSIKYLQIFDPSRFLGRFLIEVQQFLDLTRFLGFISIEARQLLRSIEPIFFALCLLDRFSTNSRSIETFFLLSIDRW